jgi:hypothetical protein
MDSIDEDLEFLDLPGVEEEKTEEFMYDIYWCTGITHHDDKADKIIRYAQAVGISVAARDADAMLANWPMLEENVPESNRDLRVKYWNVRLGAHWTPLTAIELYAHKQNCAACREIEKTQV